MEKGQTKIEELIMIPFVDYLPCQLFPFSAHKMMKNAIAEMNKEAEAWAHSFNFESNASPALGIKERWRYVCLEHIDPCVISLPYITQGINLLLSASTDATLFPESIITFSQV